MISDSAKPFVVVRKIGPQVDTWAYLELEGQQVQADPGWGRDQCWNSALALDGDMVTAVKISDADFGRVGFRTDDDSIHVLHWKAADGAVVLRFGDTLLTIDLAYTKMPGHPRKS